MYLFSNDQGGQLTFGGVDADFTGIGGSVCLLVILLMFTLSTLIGHLVPNLLEVCGINITGQNFFLSLGGDDPYWRRADDHCWGPGCLLPLEPVQSEELLQGLASWPRPRGYRHHRRNLLRCGLHPRHKETEGLRRLN